MRSNSYILKINNPCNQDWASMTETDIGKFCSRCAKTVIDFTALTDTEIVERIERMPGKICGRLTNVQLNRLIEIRHQKNRKQFLKIFAGLLLVGTVEYSYANPKMTLQKETLSANSVYTIAQQIRTPGYPASDTIKNIIKGKLYDAETKEPIPYATVLLKDTRSGVATDLNGMFNLLIPDSLLTEKLVIEISSVGYQTIQILMDKNDLAITKDLLLIPSKTALTGEVVVIKKKKWWHSKKRKKKSCP